MTMWIDGSSRTRAASVVIGSWARSRPSRRRVTSTSAIAPSRSRQPARSSRVARCASRSLTTPAPTVPRPSSPIRTSFMPRAGSAGDVLEAAQGLADPLLVLDQREPHVALAVLAEADAGGHGDLGLL